MISALLILVIGCGIYIIGKNAKIGQPMGIILSVVGGVIALVGVILLLVAAFSLAQTDIDVEDTSMNVVVAQ